LSRLIFFILLELFELNYAHDDDAFFQIQLEGELHLVDIFREC
jgi:hypothetical protein